MSLHLNKTKQNKQQQKQKQYTQNSTQGRIYFILISKTNSCIIPCVSANWLIKYYGTIDLHVHFLVTKTHIDDCSS